MGNKTLSKSLEQKKESGESIKVGVMIEKGVFLFEKRKKKLVIY
jgi:hypothetical protein